MMGIVWTRWVKFNLESKKYRVGIIIFYFISFEKFFIFVIYKRFYTIVLFIYVDDIILFKTVKEDLSGWRFIVDGKLYKERN